MKKENLPKEFQERIDRFNRLFIQGTLDTENPHNFEEDELFEYEVFCMTEAIKIAEFIKDNDTYSALLTEAGTKSLHEFIKFLKNKGLKLNDGHSGNTMKQSFSLFLCYITRPDLIPYMHGSLAPLVGDTGYYDDRSDIPNW